ncbi:MAG: response regulator transcription factor [Pseudomonadota bacterium]
MKPRVLIVEDNVVVARHLQYIIESEGCEVVGMATDAERAYNLVDEHVPDVAFIDIGLNGPQDGVSLAAQIRDKFDTKIVFATSHSDKETLERLSLINQDGYILKPFSEEAIKAVLSLVLISPSRASETVNLAKLASKSTLENRFVQSTAEELESFIDRKFNTLLTLKEMADHVDLSEGQFARRFRATFGLSPYQYVIKKRIDEAKRLLRSTDWALVEISDAVGFGSQSHFTTAFKKAVGVTPLTYRKM